MFSLMMSRFVFKLDDPAASGLRSHAPCLLQVGMRACGRTLHTLCGLCAWVTPADVFLFGRARSCCSKPEVLYWQSAQTEAM